MSLCIILLCGCRHRFYNICFACVMLTKTPNDDITYIHYLLINVFGNAFSNIYIMEVWVHMITRNLHMRPHTLSIYIFLHSRGRRRGALTSSSGFWPAFLLTFRMFPVLITNFSWPPNMMIIVLDAY